MNVLRSFPRRAATVAASASLLIAWCTTARAADAVVSTENVTARLLTEHSVVQPGQRVAVMLHQKIRSGWHTYWLNPGDSGQATQISWQLPEKASAQSIQWPTPELIRVGPLVNYGYSNDVGLVSTVSVPADWPPGTPFPVAAKASWLVCEEICIPEGGQFALSIPTAARSEVAAAQQPLFAAVRARQPTAAPFATTLTTRGDEVLLHVSLPAPAAGRVIAAQVFPAQWGVINHASAQSVALDAGGLVIAIGKGELPTPPRFAGIVTLRERGAQAVQAAYLVGGEDAAVASPRSPAMAVSVIIVLLSAFAGGLLLNLMPCVFPILAMKALTFVTHAAETKRRRVVSGLAYTAGVLTSFVTLGAVLLAMMAGGSAVGWGFQLQNPVVVCLIADVLFVSALNLSGAFEISGSFMGVGSRWASRRGASGSFFTGVLAAVVATPCTAPFMATAVGVAITQSPQMAIATFSMLGFGLAFPFLALSASPGLARRMPRPGAWMNTLRQALAFPLYASAAWLVWVLAQQAGANGVFMALLGMILLTLAIWLWTLSGTSSPRRTLRLTIAAAAALASVTLALGMRTDAAPSGRQSADAGEPFVQERFLAARKAGLPLFINMTAAWCVTCKVNERVALSGDGFRRALRDGGYTYFKGDWTNQNPDITQLLATFDRAGVPLYVVYPANGGAPVVLPQLLTESIVVEALQAATDAHSST